MASPLPSPLAGLPASSLRAIRAALLRDAGWDYVGWLSELGWAGGAELAAAFDGWRSARGDARPAGDLDAGAFRRAIAEFLAAAGWGTCAFEALGDGLLSVSSPDGPDADPSAALPYPGCYATGGLLAGFCSAIGGVTLTALETECRSAGQARCRWVIGSPEAVQHVYDAIARGEGPDAAAQDLGA